MKNRIVKILIALITVLSIVGYTTTVTGSTLTTREIINTQDIKKYSEWNNQDLTSQVFYVCPESDLNDLYDALKNRNGKIIIEVSNDTMTAENGDDINSCDYYRHYDTKRFSIGDHQVQSVFIYSPGNNAVDDILYRIDSIVQR